MKTPRKTAVKALAAVPLLALALTSCSSEPQDPAAIMSEYVEHLNSGDFEAALDLVQNPGDVTAERMVKLQDINSDEITTQAESLQDDEGKQVVDFSVGTESLEVSFIRSNDDWKLEEPELITRSIGGSTGDILSGDVVGRTDDSMEVSDGDYVIVGSEAEIELTLDFPGNYALDAQKFKTVGTFSNRSRPEVPVMLDDAELTITDELYESVKQSFLEDDSLMFGSGWAVMSDFPSHDHCSVVEPDDDAWYQMDLRNFTVECFDEDQINVEVSIYNDSRQKLDGNVSGVFRSDISNEHVAESWMHSYIPR